MDLNCVRRITLKAADLDAEPVTEVILKQEEIELLKKKLESVRKNQQDAKPTDYNKFSKEKLVLILSDREKEHRKIETFYRTQVDELEAELCDARELIISLIDDQNDIDQELFEIRKQRQDFKSQMQSLEIELSKKVLEKDEIFHNFELAQKQIHRYTQQLEEEHQKIEMLNVQTTTLQDSLQKEKQAGFELNKKLSETKGELQEQAKMIDELQAEVFELKKTQEFAENLTDSNTKDAIMNLSMIILSKDKSHTLTDVQKYLINQVFGTKCSKVIEASEQKIEKLNEKNKRLRENFSNAAILADMWFNEFISLCDWVDEQSKILEERKVDQSLQNFAEKIEELKETKKDAEEANNNPKAALNLSARLSVKERDEAISAGRPFYGVSHSEDMEKLQKRFAAQKKELEELRAKLHEAYLLESQMRDQISELISSNSSLKKNSPKVELMRFLQCQASIVEELINDQIVEA